MAHEEHDSADRNLDSPGSRLSWTAYKREDGRVDWARYRRDQVAVGEICKQESCGRHLHSAGGSPRLCDPCEKLEAGTGHRHWNRCRCPHCGGLATVDDLDAQSGARTVADVLTCRVVDSTPIQCRVRCTGCGKGYTVELHLTAALVSPPLSKDQ